MKNSRKWSDIKRKRQSTISNYVGLLKSLVQWLCEQELITFYQFKSFPLVFFMSQKLCGTLWIPRGALTDQRCSLVTRCGIMNITGICKLLPCSISHQASTWLRAVLFSVVFILSVVLRIRVVCVSKNPSKVFELNLRYFGQRRYRSGQMYWMTFLRPWPCSRLWHR